MGCKKERWTRMRKGMHAQSCNVCSMKKHRCEQKVARFGVRTSDGYIRIHKSLVSLRFHPMALKAGNIPEHRLVMAMHLGRCLERWEVVHHKNGVKDDNHIENLLLISGTKHEQITILENRITQLEKDNAALRRETSRFGCGVKE